MLSSPPREHLFYLVRGFYGSLLYLYTYVLFIDQVGGVHFAKLFSFVALLNVAVMALIIWKGRFQTYFAIFFHILTLVSLLCSFALPESIPLTFFVAISSFVYDFTVSNILPVFVQVRTNPVMASSAIATFYTLDIYSKFSAGVVLLTASRMAMTVWMIPILLISGLASMLLFPRNELKKFRFYENRRLKARISAYFQSLRRNKLIMFSLAFCLWYPFAKLLTDILFSMELSLQFPNREKIGSFVSLVDLAIGLASVTLVPRLSRMALSNMELAQAATIMPLGIIAFGTIGLLVIDWKSTVGFYFIFMLLYRAFYRPLVRLFYVPLNKSLGNDINYFNLLLSFMFMIIASFGVNGITQYLDRDLLLYALVLLSALVIIWCGSLDTHYVSSLWSYLKEEDEKSAESLPLLASEIMNPHLASQNHPFNSHNTIKSRLLGARNPYDFWRALRTVLLALKSRSTTRRDSAVALVCGFTADARVKLLARQPLHNQIQITNHRFFQIQLRVDQIMRDFDIHTNMVTRSRVTHFLRGHLDHLDHLQLEKVKIISILDPALCQDLFELLGKNQLSNYYPLIFDCVVPSHTRPFYLDPLLNKLEQTHFVNSADLLNLVSDLAKHDRDRVAKFVSQMLTGLINSNFRFRCQLRLRASQLDLFFKAIYLAEVLQPPKNMSKMIRSSLQWPELDSPSATSMSFHLTMDRHDISVPSHSEVVFEMHRRFLQTSSFGRQFGILFS